MMKLDDQFKQLQNHPENERLERDIRAKLDEKNVKKPWNLLGSPIGEWSFVLVFVVLASFLLVTSLNDTNQATSDSIKAIYSYKSSGSSDDFRAKPSTNYIGMENVTTDSLLFLFENIDELPSVDPQTKQYTDYQLIVVYENGEQRRFELDYYYNLYDVDKDIFYTGLNQFPQAVYVDLQDAHVVKLPIILLPILILIVTGATSLFYSKRKIQLSRHNQSMYVATAIYAFVMIAIFYYAYNIGLLYRPFVFVLILLLGYILWWPIKRETTNPTILRVEKLKIIVLVLSVVAFLFWG
ncbi:hypothetical protein [Solibacillus sp.]|uniref:hypothetical protein n=1 Tax=Solibacillus sp. TaxID=1909654 RepID=UPI003314B7FB